ncbi:MAG: acetylglutamate kinase [Endomicrobiia bacterium]
MKIIIKLSGKIINDESLLKKFVLDVKKILNNNEVIVVHGGGKQISEWMQRLSLEPKFVDGLRFTDEKTLEVVISVLCGLINKSLVGEFINNGVKKTVGLSCVDDRLVLCEIESKLGFVGGNIIKVNTSLINLLLKNKYLVLISSVGLGKVKDSKFDIVNINADKIVYALATTIKPDRVIFMTDKEGVLDEDGKLIKSLNLKGIDRLIEKKVVTEGMIPKLTSIKEMFKKGVHEIVITNNLRKNGTIISC